MNPVKLILHDLKIEESSSGMKTFFKDDNLINLSNF